MPLRPLIALLTDFGMRDAYVAQMKGVMLSICPDVQLLDLSHDVGIFDVRGAAYVLAASAAYFPAQTIFVAVVDPGVGSERRPVLLQTVSDKWFIGPDNGLFTHVVAREGLRRVAVLDRPAYYRVGEPSISATFHGRDIFGPVAAHLAAGIGPDELGSATAALLRLPLTPPRQVGQALLGEVQHIDHFGNVVTNLTPAWFDAWPKPPHVVCVHRDKTYAVQWVRTYAEGNPQMLLGLYNSDGFFEFAMSCGSAAVWLDAGVGDAIELRPRTEITVT